MKTLIRPSSEIRKNYNSIADICRSTNAPVFLTRNGMGDTVIMDLATYNQREEDLDIALKLLNAERERIQGKKGYSVDEFEANMRMAISEGAKLGER
ncbi:MAG: type II toxin-antitoxin system Phd/YefM family antitoxin [Lachnospiraceae bacterium]|jgi:PHD/YefM family antitoxin component YafN of YafNO toxin-antitoxin module|nr:type II toxin-antitoxin system Phd/YefM family antitoxin [Lachnospiraceae bacterium]